MIIRVKILSNGLYHVMSNYEYLCTYGNRSWLVPSFEKSSDKMSHNTSAFEAKLWKYILQLLIYMNEFWCFMKNVNQVSKDYLTFELKVLSASSSIWKWNAGVSIFLRECHFLPVLVSKPVPSHRMRQSYWTDFPNSSAELLNKGSTVSGW